MKMDQIERLGISGLAAASESERAELFRLARVGAWFQKNHGLLQECVAATESLRPDTFDDEKRRKIEALSVVIRAVSKTWSPPWPEDMK